MFFPIDFSSIESNSIAIKTDKVFEFLSKVNLEQFANSQSEPCLKSPVSPSTWLYFAARDQHDFFFGDHYYWVNKSKNMTPTNRVYRYYAAAQNKQPVDENITASKFTRSIYMPNFPAKKDDPILIVYRGNHSLAKKIAHGNAKLKTNFLPTVPSVLKSVQARCLENPSKDALFRELKADERSKHVTCHGQHIPRDVKQIHNAASNLRKSFIITQCQLTAIHLLCEYHLSHFIRTIVSVPEFQ